MRCQDCLASIQGMGALGLSKSNIMEQPKVTLNMKRHRCCPGCVHCADSQGPVRGSVLSRNFLLPISQSPCWRSKLENQFLSELPYTYTHTHTHTLEEITSTPCEVPQQFISSQLLAVSLFYLALQLFVDYKLLSSCKSCHDWKLRKDGTCGWFILRPPMVLDRR